VPTAELKELMSTLTAQGVNTQRILDVAYQEDLNRFAVLTKQAGADGRGILEHLAPVRMLVREFQLSLSFSIATEWDTELRLKVFPINLNYSLRHSLKFENENRMQILVEQVPLVQGTEPKEKGSNNGEG